VHLRGTHERRGFTIGSAELAAQSAKVPVHCPELNTARTCALDYFEAQAGLAQVYPWERTSALEVSTVRWVRQIAADLAFPADVGNVAQYIRDPDALLIKNFPEFRCFRDVPFHLSNPTPTPTPTITPTPTPTPNP